MTLPAAVLGIMEEVERLSTVGASYRPAEVGDDPAGTGGAAGDRLYRIEVLRRLGPDETGRQPRARYEAVLRLWRVVGARSHTEDMLAVVADAEQIAQALERAAGPPDVLVGETEFVYGETYHQAQIGLVVVTRI